MGFHRVVGIDLGTTYSAVSVWDHERNEIVVIPTATGEGILPSVVGLDPNGNVIVGAQAQNNLEMDPMNTVIEVKRLMGTYAREPSTNDPDDSGEPARVPFRKREYLPQEISAFILMELKRQAERYIGEPIHDAVITVPAYFKEPQMGATKDAAAMARLNVKRLINEPTAAAVCFGADKVLDGKKHVYAVYDLGGGTFDVSIIEVRPDSVTVVGTSGNSTLGGGDFDDRITGYVMQEIKTKHGVDLSQDHAIWMRVKREAERRKRELSASQSAWINLPFLTANLSVNISIARSTLETLIEDYLKDSLNYLDEAIESASKNYSVERDEIEQVLLVGGSTRIPRIRTLLAEHMCLDLKDVRCDVNPDEVVSRGAAIVARDLPHSDGYEGKEVPISEGRSAKADGKPAPAAIKLRDCTSHTLGINVNKSDFFPIIPKEHQIPAQKMQGGFTNAGPASEIPVLVFQGEDKVSFNNTLIGKVIIGLPEAREEGYYKFEVTFDLDESGLLTAIVREPKLKQQWEAKIQCAVRSSKEAIDAFHEHSGEAMPLVQAEGGPAPVPSQGLPKPPGGIPRPPASPLQTPVAAAAPSAAASVTPAASTSVLREPPAGIPEEFRATTRRAFKLVSRLDTSSERDALAVAYNALLAAVDAGVEDLEDLGLDLVAAYKKASS